MSNLQEITSDNFQATVLDAQTPFLVDMTASWCGPCKAIAPIVEDLAAQYEGRIGFGSLDVDACPQIPTRYSIRAVPTLLLFKDGQVIGQLVGGHPRQRIEELLKKAL